MVRWHLLCRKLWHACHIPAVCAPPPPKRTKVSNTSEATLLAQQGPLTCPVLTVNAYTQHKRPRPRIAHIPGDAPPPPPPRQRPTPMWGLNMINTSPPPESSLLLAKVRSEESSEPRSSFPTSPPRQTGSKRAAQATTSSSRADTGGGEPKVLKKSAEDQASPPSALALSVLAPLLALVLALTCSVPASALALALLALVLSVPAPPPLSGPPGPGPPSTPTSAWAKYSRHGMTKRSISCAHPSLCRRTSGLPKQPLQATSAPKNHRRDALLGRGLATV